MRITNQTTDRAVLLEIGQRAISVRIDRNWTQAELAHEAGVSKRTVERFEAGHSVQLSSLIRVCRALGLLSAFDALIPLPAASPIELLKLQGKKRQRASKRSPSQSSRSASPEKEAGADQKTSQPPQTHSTEPWQWGEDS